MAKYELLNNVNHKTLKITQGHSIQFGDNVMLSAISPIEFRNVQNSYPIFFQKDESTEQYVPVALFGFVRDENLFLVNDTWQSNYIPLRIRKGPFFIGFKNQNETADTDLVISIDVEDPRVNTLEGHSVFSNEGENSQYLDEVSKNLQQLHEGEEYNNIFTHLLVKYDLLESVKLDIELKDSSQNNLVGFHTINEDKLASLSDDAVTELHKKGVLAAIYMIIASHSTIHDLIDMKNNNL